jgi:gliding motility-associated-like protein
MRIFALFNSKIKSPIMRKFFLVFLLAIALWQSGQSQNLTFTFSKVEIDPIQNAAVDVTCSNFNDVVGFQYTMTWDSTKFKFISITDKTNTIAGVDVGEPGSGPAIKQGVITVTWNSSTGNGLTVPNNTKLFTLNLRPTANLCDSTLINGANLPTKQEYYTFVRDSFITRTPTIVAGKAKIKGPNCGGGNPGGGGGNTDSTSILVKIGSAIAPTGTSVCLPVNVDRFKAVAAFEAKFNWDPTVLKLKDNGITGFLNSAINFNYDLAPTGTVKMLWENVANPASLANGSKLLDFCFDIIGASGTSSSLTLDTSSSNTGFIDFNNKDFKFIVNPQGVVTVGAVKPVELSIGQATANAGDTVTISFKVNNFDQIVSSGFKVTYDPAILQFINRDGDADPSGTQSSVTVPGTFNYNYLNAGGNGITLPNGSTLFTIKFKALPCTGADKVSAIQINSAVTDFIKSPTIKLPVSVTQGSATIKCGAVNTSCNSTIGTIKNVSCRGGNDGSINVTIANTTGTCTAVWKKNGVAFGSALPITTPNLTGLSIGTYLLEVTCGGVVQCTATATISEPAAAISITETVTNIGCGTSGAIALNVTGGTPSYTYKWSNNATTKDLSGLAVGTFIITVTDGNNCTSSKSINVVSALTSELLITPNVTNVKCNKESNGAITLNVTGGCTPYKYIWANSTETGATRSGLASGTYNVTVSDAGSPAKTSTLTITVNTPTEILVSGVTTASTGANGTIVLTTTGGGGTYTYNWGNNVTTKDRSALASGTYTVTVTDNSGCTVSRSFVVTSAGATLSLGSITIPTSAQFNGFGVSCVNLCDAQIDGSVLGGDAPFTIALTGANSATQTLTQAGSFSFKGLCAGNYTIRVTDNSGTTATGTTSVSTPTAISITESITCANGVLPTGSINLNVAGGAGAYKYAWSNSKTVKDLDVLAKGVYSIVVSDANGCQSAAKAIKVDDCNQTGNCFTDYTVVMTPNFDGVNDVMQISCATNFSNELYVYDRWGKQVFNTKNYSNIWDGKDFNGNDLPEGGYMWVLKVRYADGSSENFKGAVTLLRQ